MATALRPHQENNDGGWLNLHRHCGELLPLDLSDLSVPTGELRSYLVAKYSDRHSIHPRHLEEIVGSIFADFGFRVRVTSYSGDGGIDVIVLDGPDDIIAGVQVKRQHGKVEAEQIRAFVGALVLKDITRGIYVTTSTFRKGALVAADVAASRGVPIVLIDSARLLDALKISQRPKHTRPDDPDAPFYLAWQAIDSAPVVAQSGW